MGMTYAKAVVIKDRVYCGGGVASDDDDYRVFCYSPLEDTWNKLPACHVRSFGLGQLRGKLGTVGGRKKSDDEGTILMKRLTVGSSQFRPCPQRGIHQLF